jgi:hypothetical protein
MTPWAPQCHSATTIEEILLKFSVGLRHRGRGVKSLVLGPAAMPDAGSQRGPVAAADTRSGGRGLHYGMNPKRRCKNEV